MTYQPRTHHLQLVTDIQAAIPADYPHTRLLLALAQFARDDNGVWKAWPSLNTLRELCGYKDVRNVRILLGQLEKFGLISIYRRNRASNLYSIHACRLAAFNPIAAGLRKTKGRMSDKLSQLFRAAKKFIQKRKAMAAGNIFMSDKEADRAATAHAKAVQAQSGNSLAKRVMTQAAQQLPAHSRSRRAWEMEVEVTQIEIAKAATAGDLEAVTALEARLATARAALLSA